MVPLRLIAISLWFGVEPDTGDFQIHLMRAQWRKGHVLKLHLLK